MRSVPPLPSGLEPERGLPAPSVVRSWGISVLAVATILAMLYLGRALLVPVTLAVVLSFAIAPLVRTLGRFGLTHAASVFAAISTVGLVLAAAALVIGFEAYELVGSLPAYETTIAGKLDTVHRSVVERMRPVEGAAVRILRPVGDDHDGVIKHGLQVPVLAGGVVPVEIRNPPVTPADLMRRALASLWGPVGSAGVVAIVLVFVLLEHESLRDRFIRLAGGSDLRATTNCAERRRRPAVALFRAASGRQRLRRPRAGSRAVGHRAACMRRSGRPLPRSCASCPTSATRSRPCAP